MQKEDKKTLRNMGTIYLVIVIFLLCLAIFDLSIGVSNDSVNFLQPAVGSKAASFRTIVIIAAFGVFFGALMSSGMMDVARHIIMVPKNFSFTDVMTIYLATMTTDIFILDTFNSLGMPTSTSVSLVFELLGSTFVLALFRISEDPSLSLGDLVNGSKALNVIIAIFVSVAIAFVFGVIVQWIARLIFTFRYKQHLKYTIAIFGGIAITALSYFIFIEGLAKSPYLSSEQSSWIMENQLVLLSCVFVGSTIVMEVFHLLRVNVLKLIVFMGTFAIAMSFAGNDLVNFIGAPLAGLDSYLDYTRNGIDIAPDQFMMVSLMESAKTPPVFLLIAGSILVISMLTSKKAINVINTSVSLASQNQGDEMFGSSAPAREMVRATNNATAAISKVIPLSIKERIRKRFDNKAMDMNEGAAFDMIRASVNLVIASILITIGTNYKLPLSTTYVTFMVAMGSSLADKAWPRESAVFRVTGVISVIGGWFLTAFVAFIISGIVCWLMHIGGFIVQILFMASVVYFLITSNKRFAKRLAEKANPSHFQIMMRTEDPKDLWDLLRRHVSNTQSFVCGFVIVQYDKIVDGLINERANQLKHVKKALDNEKAALKKYRRQELIALQKAPVNIALQRNTWFHVGANASEQYLYCLRRMLEPIREHIDNNFNPFPDKYYDEYSEIHVMVKKLLQDVHDSIDKDEFENYSELINEVSSCKKFINKTRKKQIDRIQTDEDFDEFQISLVYLNLLQETQQLVLAMRNQLRASKKFMAKIESETFSFEETEEDPFEAEE